MNLIKPPDPRNSQWPPTRGCVTIIDISVASAQYSNTETFYTKELILDVNKSIIRRQLRQVNAIHPAAVVIS